MENYTLRTNVISLTILLAFFCVQAAWAQEAATLYSSQGTVETKPISGGDWQPIAKGATLSIGDEIRTGKNSRAGLKFEGGKLVRLRGNSYLKIEPPVADTEKKGRMNLVSGFMYLFSRESKDFGEVGTPEVSAAIRGTELVVGTENGETTIAVLNGQAEMSNSQGTVVLGRGEEGRASLGSAPTKSLIADPQGMVQWAVHFPPMLHLSDYLDTNTLSGPQKALWENIQSGNYGDASNTVQGNDSNSRFAKAYLAHKRGDFDTAVALLESNFQQNTAGANLFLSALYLSRSEVDKARTILSRVEPSIAGTSQSIQASFFAQRALIALLKNDKEKAKHFSDQALAANDSSPTAGVVASHIAQAFFDVDAAAEAVNRVLAKYPHNAAALARLAEIELGRGHFDSALANAEAAVDAEPANSYALSVLGFANLTRYDTESAKRYFERAIDADDSHGLPYLGRGLATVHEGNLEQGTLDLEKAAHLEPNTALYRSYLGKAYFEEEREELADEEYANAIAIDPEDPTPYMYRAFNKLSQNRPVHALQDIEESVALNDNRGVYRSKLLLDQDRAVRSTSLGEVYEQLGFSKVAELAAMRSINQDYTNFSAHRLLSETLDGDFFADAQFTESIIADLLAPVSFNTFASLDGFSGQASLNEYQALFDRNQSRTGIEGIADSNDSLLSGSVFQNGKVDEFGYLVGYSTDYARGRKNGGDFLRRHRFNLGTQYQLDYYNRLIFQGGYTRFEDETLDYGADIEDFEFSVGSHHKLDANNLIVTRVEYFNRALDSYEDGVAREVEESFTKDGVEFFLDDTEILLNELTDEDFATLRYSAQHIYRRDIVSVITGAQFVDTEGGGDESSLILEDTANFFTGFDESYTSEGDFDSESYSVYSYWNWHLADWLDVNTGLSYSQIELPQYDVIAPFADGVRDQSKVSPKAGFSIYPNDSLILRGAYFRNLGISNVSDIGSIEPTIVGSFTQTFGDLPGAESENYGLGIDYKVPKTVYMGTEYVYRDIERDGIDLISDFNLDFDTLSESQALLSQVVPEQEREHIWKSYLYGVFSDSLTGTLEYTRTLLEAIDIDETNDTDVIAAGLNYFSDQRWFTFTKLAWRNQYLQNVSNFTDGSNDFWVLDFGVGYRIPKRHGIIRAVLRNVLDQEFEYADRGREQAFYSDLSAFLEVAVNF